MKQILLLLLLAFSMQTLANEQKATLLEAWENLQKNSSDIEQFKKISDKKYWIKFATLPYEGELVVLAYNVEDVDFAPEGSPYTKTGYVEVDLVDASAERIAKYARTYSKWGQNNTFFLNDVTGKWDTLQTWQKQLEMDLEENTPSSWLLNILEYWDYLFAALIIYFFFTMVFGNKHMKESITLQKKAMDDFDQTKRYMEESRMLHGKTNQLLAEILQELKNR